MFSFSGEDCLYRDHFGNRVLADVEGCGSFRVDSPIETLSVSVDDTCVDWFEGSYDHSLLVTTSKPGSYQIEVAAERTESLTGSVQDGEKFEGCGWIVGAEQIFDLDGEHGDCGLGIGDWGGAQHRKLQREISADPGVNPPQSTIPDPQFPLPFFRHATGKGLRVIMAAETSHLVDAFDLSDESALRGRGWQVQNVSKLFDLDSCFPNGTSHQGQVLSHLNAASWRVAIPARCRGLIVRKLYDAFHGRQRARVLVDGHFAGWWYEPWQDRTCRWRWARFGIEPRLLEGKTEATITVDPPAGSPLWSVSRIEVLGLMGR